MGCGLSLCETVLETLFWSVDCCYSTEPQLNPSLKSFLMPPSHSNTLTCHVCEEVGLSKLTFQRKSRVTKRQWLSSIMTYYLFSRPFGCQSQKKADSFFLSDCPTVFPSAIPPSSPSPSPLSLSEFQRPWAAESWLDIFAFLLFGA